MVKKPISTFLILLLILILPGCYQYSTQPLRLGTNVWPGYEPLYLAREQGKFNSEHVRLIEYPSASEVIRAFRNRAIEAASLTLDEALLLVNDGYPVKIILVHDISNGADVILARSGIKNMKQIVGSRVAVESGALGSYMITRALEIHGIDINDITIKHLDVNEHERAYDNEEVDVVVNFEPVRTRLINKGAVEIFSSKEIYGEIVDVMVVHEEIYEKRKDALTEITRGWFTALDEFSKNRQAAAGIMAKRLNISAEEVIHGFDGLELPGKQLNKKMLGGENPQLLHTAEKLVEVMGNNRLIKPMQVSRQVFTDEFIR